VAEHSRRTFFLPRGVTVIRSLTRLLRMNRLQKIGNLVSSKTVQEYFDAQLSFAKVRTFFACRDLRLVST
jgi:hypothetical protein